MDPLSLGATFCVMLIIFFILFMIISVVFKVVLEFLPAAILAVAVWWFTKDIFLALVTFGVIAFVMFLVRASSKRG